MFGSRCSNKSNMSSQNVMARIFTSCLEVFETRNSFISVSKETVSNENYMLKQTEHMDTAEYVVLYLLGFTERHTVVVLIA